MTFSVDEGNGTVTVNLARRTGTLSDSITVCINVTMLVDPAIIQRMYEYNAYQSIIIMYMYMIYPQLPLM